MKIHVDSMHNHSHQTAWSLLLHALSGLGADLAGTQEVLAAAKERGEREGEHEVVLTMNGIELDFMLVVDTWERHIDEAVEAKAKELVQEIFDDQKREIEHAVGELQEELQRLITPERLKEHALVATVQE